MKPIITDISDFPTLIEGGYVYVDKTALLNRLVSGVDGRFFFISRPRRFGKSLMISTLEQIFRGNRHLFEGLAISGAEREWKPHPVLRLDMSQVRAPDIAGYRRALCEIVASLARTSGLGLEPDDNPGLMLGRLLDAMVSGGEKAVVLIDEYDSPIGGLLDDPPLLEAVRKLFHDFYLVFKARSADVRFLLMTGVSKFAKLSVFSGLNNLTDISMSEVYAPLLGYTRSEIETELRPHVSTFADRLGVSPEQIVLDLLDWYDSYRFSPESEVRVCNPVSVGRALQESRFYGFWDATGNSSLIIERLRKAHKTPLDLEGLMVRQEQLDVCDIAQLPVASLLYQGGYLTIDRRDVSGLLVLRVPNREVRQSLDYGFVSSVLQATADDFTNSALRLVAALDSEPDPQPVLNRMLAAIFAMIPHEWKLGSEAEAKRYFLLFLRMAGARINAEVESSNGRADAILETGRSVYVFEFKYGKTAKAALRQILDGGYASPYAADRRRIFGVGVNYAKNTGAISVDSELLLTIPAVDFNDRVALEKAAIGLEKPAIDPKESAIDAERPAIGLEDSAIGTQKLAIGQEKSAIDSVKSAIGERLAALQLSAPTRDKVLVLYDAFGATRTFGRSDVSATVHIQYSTAGSLIALLRKHTLIIPVTGEGKGKYRFAPDFLSTYFTARRERIFE